MQALWQRPIRAFVWTLDLCDVNGEPSLAKGMAAYLAVLTGFDIYVHGVTPSNCAMAAMVLSAAFGRSAWMHYLSRTTNTNNQSSSVETKLSIDAAALLHALKEKRDAARGVDPA